MSEYPETPELNKVKVARDEGASEAIGEFLEWMTSSAGYTICTYSDGDVRGFYPTYKSTQELLADYFEIDLKAVAREQAAIIEHIRAQA